MYMDNKEISKRLEGFEEVWKRVTAARTGDAPSADGAAELMPGKRQQSRAVRFCPPRK